MTSPGSRTSIYLPTRVYEQAKHLDINISKVCRQALEAEFAKRRRAIPDAIERAYSERMPPW